MNFLLRHCKSCSQARQKIFVECFMKLMESVVDELQEGWTSLAKSKEKIILFIKLIFY